jgi:ribosomal protein L40E
MAKFPEAEARLFGRKFICKNCKSAIRAPNLSVIQGKIKCRKCSSRALRPVRKK